MALHFGKMTDQVNTAVTSGTNDQTTATIVANRNQSIPDEDDHTTRNTTGCTDLLPPLQRKVVRDLWWCIATPNLLVQRRQSTAAASASSKLHQDATAEAKQQPNETRSDTKARTFIKQISSEFGSLVSDEWIAEIASHPLTKAWLKALDKDNSHLIDWISTDHAKRFRRLGFYYACVS